MKKSLIISFLLVSLFAFGQEKSELYKEESKDVNNIVKLMSDKCFAYQFSLVWVRAKYAENDPRRVKFSDEVLRKFLKDCKNADLDKFETKARLNYKNK